MASGQLNGFIKKLDAKYEQFKKYACVCANNLKEITKVNHLILTSKNFKDTVYLNDCEPGMNSKKETYLEK